MIISTLALCGAFLTPIVLHNAIEVQLISHGALFLSMVSKIYVFYMQSRKVVKSKTVDLYIIEV
jgi:hypothetical protein